MEQGYITLLAVFLLSQITTVVIVALLINSRRQERKANEKLRSEIFEQYREYMTKNSR